MQSIGISSLFEPVPVLTSRGALIIWNGSPFRLVLVSKKRAHGEITKVSDTGGSEYKEVAMAQLGNHHLVYGTAWKKDSTHSLVSQAIRKGFRFIDTACQPKHYNEVGVGEGWTEAVEDLGLQRSDLHLQTKFTPMSGQDPNNIPYDIKASLEDQVRQSVHASLENLQTTYLDSLVLHTPLPTHEKTMEVWRVFESFVDEGVVKALGISNCYKLEIFSRLHHEARIKPTTLQNRFHAKTRFDSDLRRFCDDKGVLYQPFWTLTANREALATKGVKEMARKKGLTPQTLMYAFLMTLGYAPLSGTTSLDHMEEDAALMRRFEGGKQVFTDERELSKMADALGVAEL